MTRTHLVSGVTSGIGAAYAARVRSEGDKLIAIVRSEKQIASIPADQYIIFDYAQPETLPMALRQLGEIDVFVSAAGILHGKNFAEVNFDQAVENVTVNLLTPMLLAQYTAPKLRKGGVMIFLGSVSGHKGSYDDGYAAAKGGIHSFVKSLALKLAKDGKRAVAIAPGITEGTRMTDTRPDTELAEVMKKIPMQRFAAADEIADAIWFVASDAARSMTGAILDINGGQYLR